MRFANSFAKSFKYLLPSPFAIAVLLTVLTFTLALVFTKPEAGLLSDYALKLTRDWSNELWNGQLMVFAMQMMLMLVLGHVLALAPIVNRAIGWFVKHYCSSQAQAAAVVTLLTLLVSLFNWGLGLIFGAIFARKVGEHFAGAGRPLNYALIGAAGYSGLMVWHGGISGSSLIKVAETGHLASLMEGVFSPAQINGLPAQMPFSETVFSGMNITANVALLVILPFIMYLIGKRSEAHEYQLASNPEPFMKAEEPSGADRIDHSKYFGIGLGAICLLVSFYNAIIDPHFLDFGFITPNWINLLLLGLALLLHTRFVSFLKAVNEAIGGAAGILIQFPIYFGIMGLMRSSGMVEDLAIWITTHSTETTYPLFTFLSAALVNVFVPSGGGQWAIQGPIIVSAANDLGVPLSKSILAMAYGDQLTNMLQPFWALPLLGITQLRAKAILPYTLALMAVGGLVFITALLLF